MAGEKRSFPFSDQDIPTTYATENKWKRQCISSDFLKRQTTSTISLVNGSSKPSTEESSMECDNCTNIPHQNGHITFGDFQNGYHTQVDIRFKNGHSVNSAYSIQNGHSLNSSYSIQNGHSLNSSYSIQNGHSVNSAYSIQNGHSLLNGTIDNNNSNSGSSPCIRCQAGEPGHIGHIGR